MAYRFILVIIVMLFSSGCVSSQMKNSAPDKEKTTFEIDNCRSDQINRLVLLSFMIGPHNKKYGLNINPAKLSEKNDGSFTVNGKETIYSYEAGQMFFSDTVENSKNYAVLNINDIQKMNADTTDNQLLCRGTITVKDIKKSVLKTKKNFLMEYKITSADRENPHVEFMVINIY